jgi:hypothetical protein
MPTRQDNLAATRPHVALVLTVSLVIASGCTILKRNRVPWNEHVASRDPGRTSVSLFILPPPAEPSAPARPAAFTQLSAEAQAEHLRLSVVCKADPAKCPPSIAELLPSPPIRTRAPSIVMQRRFVLSLEYDAQEKDEFHHADRLHRAAVTIRPLWSICSSQDEVVKKKLLAGGLDLKRLCKAADDAGLNSKATRTPFIFTGYDKVESLFETINIGSKKLTSSFGASLEGTVGTSAPSATSSVLPLGAGAKASVTGSIGSEELAVINERITTLNVSLVDNGGAMRVRTGGAPGRGVDGSILVQAEARPPTSFFDNYPVLSVENPSAANPKWIVEEVRLPVSEWLPFFADARTVVRRVRSGSWTFSEADDFADYISEAAVSPIACTNLGSPATWEIGGCDKDCTVGSYTHVMSRNSAGIVATAQFWSREDARLWLEKHLTSLQAPKAEVHIGELTLYIHGPLPAKDLSYFPRESWLTGEFEQICFGESGSNKERVPRAVQPTAED